VDKRSRSRDPLFVRALIAGETDKWNKIIKLAGLKSD
jgi:hypothetical protein